MNAYAKINLSLEIFPKRSDGFHNIETVFQSIELHDEIEVEKSDRISLEMFPAVENIPTDDKNLAYVSAKILCDEFELPGVKITLKKNIPSSAGLAGGSADSAAVLNAVNNLYSLNLSKRDLEIRAEKIGSDVSFCISGGTQFGTGRGEILQPLKNLPSINIVVVKPEIEVSTAWAYKTFDEEKIFDVYDSKKMLNAIEKSDWNLISKNIFNRFELIIGRKFPEIIEIKKQMLELGAMNAMMSGSGSSVFGIFENPVDIENLKKYGRVFLTRTLRSDFDD